MQVQKKEAMELLETLAFQEAAEGALHGRQHASRIAHLPAGGWQAEMIRQAADVAIVENAESLRAAMQKPETVVIFLPQTAMVTAEIIERICAESPLAKMIIWETAE
ncbi:MAG TPA: hypothetical protein VHP34_05290 [Alphaproteobacteria bacterium]|nr:hypothetical protein [Alphaproteobacteria bacterium]